MTDGGLLNNYNDCLQDFETDTELARVLFEGITLLCDAYNMSVATEDIDKLVYFQTVLAYLYAHYTAFELLCLTTLCTRLLFSY